MSLKRHVYRGVFIGDFLLVALAWQVLVLVFLLSKQYNALPSLSAKP